MSSENNRNVSRIVTVAAILLLLATGIYLTVEMGRRQRTEDVVKEQKLKSEALLAEKLSLEKDIMGLKSDIESMAGKNNDLDKILASTSQKLNAVEQELSRTNKQNASIAQLKRQQLELSKIKEALEEEIVGYKNSLKQLQSSNEDLEIAVAMLQEQNKALTSEVNALRMSTWDDLLIQTQKKNGKLTVKGKRTKKLIIEVDVPAASENLTLRVTDPQGKEQLASSDEVMLKVTKKETKNTRAFFVAPTADRDSPEQSLSKRVEMVYSPKKKLMAGLYKIVVQNDAVPIGSLQVKLR